jgi:putative FmdB family regulatory protein
MPIYQYDCARCGPFTQLRPLAEFAAPCACPGCGAAAERNLLAAPALRGAAETRDGVPAAPRHPAACACCAPRRGLRAEPACLPSVST